MEVFGSSGVRGLANADVTPGFAADVAAAAGSVWGADRAAVGRDTRTTGPMLAAAVASGLASVGVDVEDLGVVPTPALQAYAEAEAVPGIAVTASHNPPEYNGLKLIGADGIELSVADLEAIEGRFLGGTTEPAGWDEVGDVAPVEGANRRYLEGLRDAVDPEAFAEGDLTVAIDPGHGAGAHTSPAFFRDLGCSVLTVNAQSDGRFPGRDPEPVSANLDDLRRLVSVSDADLGIAHDGDADRAVFVDERGEPIEGDAALAALAAATLTEGDVAVAAVNVSQRLVDAVNATGARLEITPVGSTRIVTRIRELADRGERVAIAGEGNGGIVFPEYRLARDGAYTAARFLELVVERPASAVVEAFGGYYNERLDVAYDGPADREALLEAARSFAEEAEAEVTSPDGFRLDYGDSWVLVRPSGTEPLVRVYAEARDPDRARELAERARRAVEGAATDP